MKKFLQILLMPFARFCVRQGILLPECIDSLKTAFLSASVEQLQNYGEDITASRLSTMSGVHRKDSARFIKGFEPCRDTVPIPIKVLGSWHSKKRYLDTNGKPRALSIGEEESEFARLVQEISTDVHPYNILKELERLSLVEVADGKILPLKSSYVSSLNDEGTAKIIARDLHELILSAEENIAASGRRPNHHTTTEYDNIPEEHLPALREWISREAGALHKKVREYVSQYDLDISDRKPASKIGRKIRFVFGSFGRVNYREDTGDDKR